MRSFLLSLSVYASLVACVAFRVPSSTPRLPPWEPTCYEVESTDDALLDDELDALIREARLGWQVVYGDSPTRNASTCIAVRLVVDPEWPVGRVGQTAWNPQTGQVDEIAFDAGWWLACPESRRVLVWHEIGHSAGHVGHGDGVMREGVDCEPDGDLPPVTESQLAHAQRTRRLGRPAR
jgi:hypothetical protein